MWTCPSCRTPNAADAVVCRSCERHRDDQIATGPAEAATPDAPAVGRVGDYSAIEEKVRRVRLRSDEIARWSRILGVIAFIATIVFSVAIASLNMKVGERSLANMIGWAIEVGLAAAVIGMVVGMVGGVAV